jgi:hypothetical protein
MINNSSIVVTQKQLVRVLWISKFYSLAKQKTPSTNKNLNKLLALQEHKNIAKRNIVTVSFKIKKVGF